MGEGVIKCVACGVNAPLGERCPKRGGGFHDLRKFDPVTRTFGHRVNPVKGMTRDEFIAECRRLVHRGTKPTLPDVKPLIDVFYDMPGNAVGGSLHSVLDDHNYERPHIVYCIQNYAMPANDEPAIWLGEVLLLLSNSQRRKV